MNRTAKLLDERIETYQREADTGIGYINHNIRIHLRWFIKDLKKIRRELMRELKNQRVLKL